MRRSLARVLSCSACLILAASGLGCVGIRPHYDCSFRDPALAAPAAATADERVLFEGTGVFDVAELRRAVLRRNPSLAALRSAWKAAVARYPQVTTLDDPMLAFGFAPQSIGSRDVDFGQQTEVSQRLPWPGKLRLRGEEALAAAESSREAYASLQLDTALAATFLFYDDYLVDRADAINDEHMRLLEEFKRVATARYGAGVLSQRDPLKAEVELAHLEHRKVTLATERDVVRARLNALLHRSSGAPLPPAPKTLPLPESDLLLERARADRDGLATLAVARRSEVAMAEADIRGRQAALELAGLERFPDFGVGTSYNSMWRDEAHRWMVLGSVNLPMWGSRLDAVEEEARANLEEAERRRESLVDSIASGVWQAAARLAEAHHVVELYRGRLLPASRDQVAAARAGFETGGNDFLALIDAERNLRSVELAYEESLVDFHRRLAELTRLLGTIPGEPLPETLTNGESR